MADKMKYPVAFLTTHPGGRVSTFLIEEVAHCGNGRAKVTIEAPCSFLEENKETKYVECIYDKGFNSEAKVVCSKKIFKGHSLASLNEDERLEVYSKAASKLTAALQSAGAKDNAFEVILKIQK